MRNDQKEYKMLAKTSFGLEEVLVEELKALGVAYPEPQNRAVAFTGNKEMLYKANIWLRTANKILVEIRRFKIRNDMDLYHKIKNIPWEDIFSVDQSFVIDNTVYSDLFKHSNFAALKMKDAIVDRFRDRTGERPNVDTENPDFRINLHISDQQCTVSLDSSGGALHKRGYREVGSFAPIKEDLAAGLILLSGWDKQSNFIDLFCGSGTILIEAAMIAFNVPPNITREDFGFMKWKDFDQTLFEQVLDDAENEEVDFSGEIIGVDVNGRTLDIARDNIEVTGFHKDIQLVRKDMKDFEPPAGNGIMVSNPPYGERIGENVEELYKELGDVFKSKYAGFNAWIISSNMEALKKVGLRPSRKIKLFNGKLECRFMKYEMYQGTKKVHKLKQVQ